MHDLKSYISRALNKAGYDYKGRKRWTRDGSTMYKWDVKDVEDAVNYVIRGQEKEMAWYERD